uniref:Rho termination factor N-terminal domain-containing protein n=1 Tax=Mycena chlorophos TaxID=658473 RepID=A0ABQ0L3S5_MYCCL|nr:predicted protein [Mycena chlorophos]
MYTQETLRNYNFHALQEICKQGGVPSYSRLKKEALITHMLQYPAELGRAWTLAHGIHIQSTHPTAASHSELRAQAVTTAFVSETEEDEADHWALAVLPAETITDAVPSQVVYGWGPYVPPPPPSSQCHSGSSSSGGIDENRRS